MKNVKRFDKLCFMDGAEELGIFGEFRKEQESILKENED